MSTDSPSPRANLTPHYRYSFAFFCGLGFIRSDLQRWWRSTFGTGGPGYDKRNVFEVLTSSITIVVVHTGPQTPKHEPTDRRRAWSPPSSPRLQRSRYYLEHEGRTRQVGSRARRHSAAKLARGMRVWNLRAHEIRRKARWREVEGRNYREGLGSDAVRTGLRVWPLRRGRVGELRRRIHQRGLCPLTLLEPRISCVRH